MTDSSDNDDVEYVDAPFPGEEDDEEGGLPFDGSYDHLLDAPTPDSDYQSKRLTIHDPTPARTLMTVSADTEEARAAIEDLTASLEGLADAALDVDEAMSRIEARDLTISIDIETDSE